MIYNHSFSRVFVLLVIMVLFFYVNGCKNDSSLDLVKEEPIDIDGGTLVYEGSYQDQHQFQFRKNNVSSNFLVSMINGTYHTSLDDSHSIRVGKPVYPNFNISIVEFGKPVKRFNEVKYFRHEGRPAFGSYHLVLDSNVSGEIRYEDNYTHGLVFDGSFYHVRYSHGTTRLSPRYIQVDTPIYVTFDNDKAIISGSFDAILKPEDAALIPYYEKVIEIKIIPINESWMSEKTKNYFEKRELAFSRTLPNNQVRLVENQWVDAGFVWLLYGGSSTDSNNEKTYGFSYRYWHEGDADGSIYMSRSGNYSMGSGYPILFNVSVISEEESVPSSRTVSYLSPSLMEQGSLVSYVTDWDCKLFNGIIVDGRKLLGCINQSGSLSDYGLDYDAQFLNDRIILKGADDIVLFEGDERSIPIDGQVVIVELKV